LTALSLFIGGSIGLAILCRRGRLGDLRQPLPVWLNGIMGIGGHHAFLFLAVARAPIGTVNLLNYLWPILIVVLAPFVTGLTLTRRHLLGAAIGFAGSVCTLGAQASFPAGAIIGCLAAVMSAVTWALYSLFSRRFETVPTGTVAGFCIVSALLAAVGHICFEATVVPHGSALVALIILGIGPAGLAFYWWDDGMKRGDPRLLGTLSYAIPVVSSALLVADGDTELGVGLFVSAVLVSAGGLICASAPRQLPPQNRQEAKFS